jgi:tartrate dehydrogenase/decarboxylase/D-malate dehydrogenase
VRTFRIAAIPGDGIGREVIAAGVEALQACARRDGGFQIAFDHFDWGSERYKKTGAFMPENGLALIKGHDAILFGSAGAPDVPDHITLWGCGSPSASPSTSTPTCGRRASCPVSPARSGASPGRSSTG